MHGDQRMHPYTTYFIVETQLLKIKMHGGCVLSVHYYDPYETCLCIFAPPIPILTYRHSNKIQIMGGISTFIPDYSEKKA